MAVSFDATASDKAVGTAITFAHTCTGANLVLYVLIGEHFASAVTGVTYNAVAMTQIAYNDPGANVITGKVFRLIAPATGAHNVVVTLASTRNVTATAISFAGVDQTTPNGAVTNTNGTGTTISDVITSATGEIVVDLTVCQEDTAGTRSITIGAGQTSRANQEQVAGGNGLQAAVSTEAGAASVTMSETIDVASSWLHSALTVHAATGDTTPPANPTVTARGAAGGAAIALTLTMPADGDLSQYEVRRLTSTFPANGRTDGTIIVAASATTPSAVVNFSDSGLTNGLRYYYRVFCKDTTGNWNTGATVSEVSAPAMTVVGWYTSSGTFKSDGETGSSPIFEWTVGSANVEQSKPAPFRFAVGSDNPGPNLEPTLDVIEFASVNSSVFTAGSFKYFSGGSWVTVPVAGVPWATVNAGTTVCRFYSQLSASQDLYGVVRVEQA